MPATGLHTVFGGMRAVLYPDALQAIILLLGSVCITGFGLSRLGGWSEFRAVCRESAGAFALWRPISATRG